MSINYEMRCRRCGVLQPLTNFTPNSSRASGYYEICKNCRAQGQGSEGRKSEDLQRRGPPTGR